MENKNAADFDAGKIMEKALDIGEAMLRSGAEVLRVEDTIMRICSAYGGGTVDVFTILSLIIVSWHTDDNENLTQTRRIYTYSTDLEKLENLNALSRYICDNKPSFEEIDEQMSDIMGKNIKRLSKSRLLGYVLTSAGFAIFFGGNIRDGIAAGVVGIFMYFWEYLLSEYNRNRVIDTCFNSIFTGVMCILSVYCGIGVHTDKIMIGTIMPLIPGINMTNALRDLMSGDMITGILRLGEALMMAVAIAVGFALAIMLFGRLIGLSV